MATSFWPAMKACAAGPGSMLMTVTSFTVKPFFFSIQASVKYGAVPGAEAATVLPFTSLIDATSLRTTMPSAPYDLSSWNSSVVATPFAFHTIQVSTVVAAHWMSPEAMAKCRLACGIFLMVTSRPFLLKMPASLARVSGAKPVHPEMPMVTFVCALAGAPSKIVQSAAVTAKIAFIVASILENPVMMDATTGAGIESIARPATGACRGGWCGGSLVSLASVARLRGCRKVMRASGSGTLECNCLPNVEALDLRHRLRSPIVRYRDRPTDADRKTEPGPRAGTGGSHDAIADRTRCGRLCCSAHIRGPGRGADHHAPRRRPVQRRPCLQPGAPQVRGTGQAILRQADRVRASPQQRART